jgi:hypothetical protein
LAMGLAAAVTLPAGMYSVKVLCRLVPVERLPRAAQRLIRWFRLQPAQTKA